MDGDRFVGFTYLDRNAVIGDEQPHLLDEIAPEQIRPRDRGFVHTGP